MHMQMEKYFTRVWSCFLIPRSPGQQDPKCGHRFYVKREWWAVGTERKGYYKVSSGIFFSWILASKENVLMSERELWFDAEPIDEWHDLVA